MPDEAVAPKSPGLFLEDASAPKTVRPRATRARSARLNPEVVGTDPDWLNELETVELRLFDDVVLEVARERVEVAPSGNHSWVGSTADHATQVLLTAKGGQLVATVSGPQGNFSVHPAGDGLVVIQQGGSSLLPCSEPPVPPVPPDAQAREEIQPLTNEGYYIDVLQVYTSALVTHYGFSGNAAAIQQQMQLVCDADVAWLNQAYINSDVNITMRNVRVEAITYTESNNVLWDLYRLTYVGETSAATVNTGILNDGAGNLWANGGSYLETAHTSRNTYGADLVMLRTSGYTNSGGVGWVTLSPNPFYSAYAFAVMGNPDDTAITMAHEFGHNQGLNHDRATNLASGGPEFDDPAYSMGYRVSGQFATIMAYPDPLDFGLVVQYFSNPAIFVNAPGGGGSMRLSDINLPVGQRPDEHRRLNEMIDTISNFRTHVAPYAPGAPTLLTATTSTADGVTLTWVDNAVGENRFHLQYRKTAEATWTSLNVAADATTFTVEGLDEFTQYSFRIRAAIGSEFSAWSNTASRRTLPEAPANLALTVLNEAQVRLDWTDSSNAETGVSNARKVGAGSFVNLAPLPANSTTFTDSGLPPSTYVNYILRNQAGVVVSAPTENLRVKTAPAIPTSVGAARQSPTSILVTWTDASSDESAFQIQRKAGAGSYAIVRSLGPGATSWLDTNRTTGVQYTYRVRSQRGPAYSHYSLEASATP